MVSKICSTIVSVQRINKNGYTLLKTGTEKVHVEIIREMLNHGAVVESSNNYFRTPFNTAGLEGHVDVVRELLNYTANVHSIKYCDKPLNTAVEKIHVCCSRVDSWR